MDLYNMNKIPNEISVFGEQNNKPSQGVEFEIRAGVSWSLRSITSIRM